MTQLKLFKEIKESIYLIANSPRKAFYRLFLETDGGSFFLRKQWGCKKTKKIKEVSLKCKNRKIAYKIYNQIIKEKTNPNRKSKRIYKLVQS